MFVRKFLNLTFVGLQLLLLGFLNVFFGIIFCLWSTLSPKKKFCLSSRSLSMSCITLFNRCCACVKDVLALFFICTCCCVIIFWQVLKFFCSVKVLFSIYLTLQVNNLKLNPIGWFTLIYLLANKLVMSLLVITKFKITSLKIRFLCFCSQDHLYCYQKSLRSDRPYHLYLSIQ